MRKLLLSALLAMPIMAHADTYDLTTVTQMYTDEAGYGYDYTDAQDLKQKKGDFKPFYFSVKVPDGNYRVTVTLGSKRRAAETQVRAESRRMMVEKCVTAKGKTQTLTFNVHKHSVNIQGDEKKKVQKANPKDPSWDDKLTLEFNGGAPAAQAITIEPVDDVTTLYLCGNSTVTDQGREPWASWGQMFPRWFNDKVVVANYAESGLTAQTFIGTNRLQKILSQVKEGDYLFCEFGHNDEKEHWSGTGAWYHYSTNLKKFVDEARAKKANIIFITPTQRRTFDKDGKTLLNSHGDFPAAMKAVAERENVPLIDLNADTKTLYEGVGSEGTKQFLVHYPMGTFPWQKNKFEDNTHFNPYGAYELSKLVVMGLKAVNSPLTQYLVSDWKDFSPLAPDDPATFYWPQSIFSDNRQPDGD